MKHALTPTNFDALLERIGWGIDHHAPQLQSIIGSTIFQAMRHSHEPRIVGSFKGKIAPHVWMMFGQTRYTISATKGYDIIVRRGSLKGPEVGRITTASSHAEIARLFASLKEAA